MYTNGDSLWKLGLLFSILISMLAVAVCHVFLPDYFVKGPANRKNWLGIGNVDRQDVQLVGVVMTCVLLYLLYVLSKDIFGR